ncbi:hypothetical protein E2I00_003145 [Balaenoptera physalus]|uniref:Uncharacterized protein n=1 Tax=Balaenoptera physalus TaxID=9770 RepID=A0A643CGT7_BALPH|nr:hypothetical protein E2I00_003145 [Balaenoptera physalus]
MGAAEPRGTKRQRPDPAVAVSAGAAG